MAGAQAPCRVRRRSRWHSCVYQHAAWIGRETNGIALLNFSRRAEIKLGAVGGAAPAVEFLTVILRRMRLHHERAATRHLQIVRPDRRDDVAVRCSVDRRTL